MNIKEFKKDNLKVNVFDTREDMGKKAAQDVINKMKELLLKNDEVNMVFAAAPSQNEFLEVLVNAEGIDWERINAFHLDEYIGLDDDATQKFGNFLKDKIFSRVNFKTVNYLNGNAKDIKEECERYGKLLQKHPIDIACIGIGENGHIAFNDPPVADFNDKYAVKQVTLDEKCRNQQVNDGCFESIDEVPKYALTMTVPAIFASKYIYCIVPGKTKATAIQDTLEGPIDESCPASILRKHTNAMLYIDKDSASLI